MYPKILSKMPVCPRITAHVCYSTIGLPRAHCWCVVAVSALEGAIVRVGGRGGILEASSAYAGPDRPSVKFYRSSRVLDIDPSPLCLSSRWLESYSSPCAQAWGGGRGVEAAQVMRNLSVNKLAVDQLQRARLGAEAFNFLIDTVCSNLEEEGSGGPLTTWKRRPETQSACSA